MTDEHKNQENEERLTSKTKAPKNIWLFIFLAIVGFNVVRFGIDWIETYPVNSAIQNHNEVYRAFKDGKLDTTEAIESALKKLKKTAVKTC